MSNVQAGAVAPERLRVTVENAELAAEPLDLGAVTATTIAVTRPDGSRAEWLTDVVSQTAQKLVVEHVYEIDDVWLPGVYHLSIALEVPEGIRRAGPTVLNVIT